MRVKPHSCPFPIGNQRHPESENYAYPINDYRIRFSWHISIFNTDWLNDWQGSRWIICIIIIITFANLCDWTPATAAAVQLCKFWHPLRRNSSTSMGPPTDTGWLPLGGNNTYNLNLCHVLLPPKVLLIAGSHRRQHVVEVHQHVHEIVDYVRESRIATCGEKGWDGEIKFMSWKDSPYGTETVKPRAFLSTGDILLFILCM